MFDRIYHTYGKKQFQTCTLAILCVLFWTSKLESFLTNLNMIEYAFISFDSKQAELREKKTESFSTWNRLKSLNFGHPMAFGMISELMDQYLDLFPIFDLFDNIFSFYPTVPYIRLHNRLIFKNHSLICRFLCIQNVLSNSIQYFECVFFLSICIQRSELIIWNDAVSSFDSSMKKRQSVCIIKRENHLLTLKTYNKQNLKHI